MNPICETENNHKTSNYPCKPSAIAEDYIQELIAQGFKYAQSAAAFSFIDDDDNPTIKEGGEEEKEDDFFSTSEEDKEDEAKAKQKEEEEKMEKEAKEAQEKMEERAKEAKEVKEAKEAEPKIQCLMTVHDMYFREKTDCTKTQYGTAILVPNSREIISSSVRLKIQNKICYLLPYI